MADYLVFELIDGWWYDPVAPANPSPLWRCQPEDQTFSCADPLSTPKAGYPVAFATGGY